MSIFMEALKIDSAISPPSEIDYAIGAYTMDRMIVYPQGMC